MFSILEQGQHNLVIQSLSFNENDLDNKDNEKLNISTSIQCYKKYYSIDLKMVRVDCKISCVGIVNNVDVAFTLNASVKVMFNVKNGISERELQVIINDRSDENLKHFNELVTPIIQKEMNDFLSKTDYIIAD